MKIIGLVNLFVLSFFALPALSHGASGASVGTKRPVYQVCLIETVYASDGTLELNGINYGNTKYPDSKTIFVGNWWASESAQRKEIESVLEAAIQRGICPGSKSEVKPKRATVYDICLPKKEKSTDPMYCGVFFCPDLYSWDLRGVNFTKNGDGSIWPDETRLYNQPTYEKEGKAKARYYETLNALIAQGVCPEESALVK